PHGLRVLAVDLLESPPPWACLERSRALPPGLAQPIAGARSGPGGVLRAPVPEGPSALRRSAATASALATNPRGSGAAWTAASRPFISRALEAWADIPAGGLEEPLSAATGRSNRGTFVRVPGPHLLLRLVRHEALCKRGSSHWHIDLP